MYNKDGEFLERVGRVGRGPGEYLQISDFDDGENILISDHSDVLLLFDKNGNFIEKKRTKKSRYSRLFKWGSCNE